ncbi:MAG: spore cortex biosynthesis protein YabQ [Oscillospiraceae bacterium]
MPAITPMCFALADSMYTLGLGLLLAIAYTILRIMCRNSKLAVFVLDVAISVIGALLYMSVITQRSYSGIVRWYTICALLCGYSMWHILIMPILYVLADFINRLINVPVTYAKKYIIEPILHLVHTHKEKIKAKRKSAATKSGKQLQNTAKVLYNSNHNV